MKRAVIIGAGASGMMAAIKLSENGVETVVLERMDAICKKIYATGNGKCNFTNLHMTNECYHGGVENIMSVISNFDNVALMDFFLESGVPSYEVNGYIYPHSRQASSISNALEKRAYKAGVNIKVNCNVKDISFTDDDKYSVIYEENEKQGNSKKNNFVRKSLIADYVIIAAGGKSQRKLGSDGSGSYLAKKMGHKIIDELPALCKLKVKEDTKSISGVRIIGKVNDEAGELIFGDSHISGIPVFQISSKIGRCLAKKEDVEIIVDTVTDISDIIVKKAIESNISNDNPNIYEGIIPDKLGKYIMTINGIDKYSSVYDAIDGLKLKFCVTATADFEESQVTAGGVSIKDINIKTMESNKYENVYFCGEVMDVDGICGGYNLQWAFTSGAIAAKSIIDKEMEFEENDTDQSN